MGLLNRFRQDVPAPKADTLPRGSSGRGHTDGFLDLEEFNADLRHPYGHTVYDKMFRTDGDVRQVVQLVSDPIISGTWQMVPYGGELAEERDVYIADAVKWALWDGMSPGLHGHIQQMLPVLVRSGMAPFEVAWHRAAFEPKGGKSTEMVIPRTLALRLPRTIEQFEQDRFGNLTRIKQRLPVPQSTLVHREGDAHRSSGAEPATVWIPSSDLVYYRIGAEGDNWEGQSLLRPAYKHWLMKDKIERIDAIAQEREALGVPICYPPLGASDAQLDEVEEVLRNMRTNEQGYIVAPGPKAGKGAPEGQGWLFEVIGYDRTGSGRDPQPSLAYHTNKIAAAFISEFMRLGHGQTGARATAQVQADPFLMSVEALTALVEQALNEQLVKPLVAHNFADAVNPPRLQMSLVDSTSLTQLADYVMKLTQIGALLPDQELEDFLRARADLPPANPKSVAKRKNKDDDLRREIVTGGGGNGDAYGANADPGKPHGSKPVTKANKSGVTGSDGTGSNNLDAEPDAVILDSDVAIYRGHRRPPRHDEMNVHLDEIEDRMDALPGAMETLLSGDIHRIARGEDVALDAAIHDHLCEAYDFGRRTVDDEIALQLESVPTHLLDRGARDRGHEHLAKRAEVAARHVRNSMDTARDGADLTHGNEGLAQAAAEKAGKRALRQVGFQHGVSAMVHGRHDRAAEIHLDSDSPPIVGVRYTSILDRNRCDHCAEADDGQVRDFDDPVRVERQPPNPHCDSTASGFNQCRCFETYEVMPEGGGVELDAGEADRAMPPMMQQIYESMIDRGLDPSRAQSVAVQRVRLWARGGSRVSPSTQLRAIEELAAWDAS